MNYGVLAWFEGRFAKVPPTQYTSKKPNAIAISDYRIKPPYAKLPPKNPTKNDLEVAPDFVDIECLDRFTTQSLKWLDGRTAAARAGKPFFLYLPYTSPHKPVIPLEEFRGQGKAGAYGEFMIETDHHLGRILKWLDDEKLADNTMVIFTSDNGPETTWRERIQRFSHHSNGIYREGKRSVYEGGHRVPFIIRWPAQVKAGSQWNQPVCQTDLLATFADMVGERLPANAGEDSISFYQVLRGVGKNSVPPRVAMVHHGSQGRYALREQNWKLVMEDARRGKRELYDLAKDPGETTNVIEQHPEVAARLVAKLTVIVRNGRSSPGPVQKNDTPPWKELIWMR